MKAAFDGARIVIFCADIKVDTRAGCFDRSAISEPHQFSPFFLCRYEKEIGHWKDVQFSVDRVVFSAVRSSVNVIAAALPTAMARGRKVERCMLT